LGPAPSGLRGCALPTP